VDNASEPPVVAPTTTGPTSVEVIRCPTNGGVGRGHNTGIHRALEMVGPDGRPPEWVWVLEHDSLVDPPCLARLLEAGSADERVGAVMPTMARNRYERDLDERTGVTAVERFTFNGVLLRAAAWRDVGPLREDLFVGLEDWDLSGRMAAAGWPILRVCEPLGLHPNRGLARFPLIPSPARHFYRCRNELLLDRSVASTLRQVAGIGADLVRYRSWSLARARSAALVDGVRGRGGRVDAARWS
jgi:GT2 family glycosyltransferase